MTTTRTGQGETAAMAAMQQREPADYIDGGFIPLTGDAIVSHNPADPEQVIWQASPRNDHVDQAVAAARTAFKSWSALSMDERVEYLRRWQQVTADNVDRIARTITAEMGKTLGESTFEAKALAAKVDITLEEYSLDRVKEYQVGVTDSRIGRCRYKPHGVMTVIGPFNFPAHLANGHFIPALLMGNTIVFKPSEKTPAVGQLLAELMHETGLPAGVFNVVQGAGDLAADLVNHDDIDGILFTGSWPVGRRILEANLDRPGRIIALEMGGSAPAVVMDDADLKLAAVECVRAAFATTGQRCTCTRRIIIHEKIADAFLPLLVKLASTLLIDRGDSDQPVFMGPVVSEQAAEQVIDFQEQLVGGGGRAILEAARMDRPGHFITPGIVEVDQFDLEHDCEVFGPLVQVSRVRDLDDAIEQSNATRYGLAASIFTSSEANFERFFRLVNAGCINWNTGTAGASGKLPFGGVGQSGNHRPAGAFSVEYCAYPVANMVEQGDDVAIPAGMHWDENWIN